MSLAAGVGAWSAEEFRRFYVAHRTALVRYSTKIVGNAQEGEEVVHDALIKVLLGSAELKTEDEVRAYLYRTVHNLSLNILRARKARPALRVVDDEDVFAELSTRPSSDPDHDTILIQAEESALVREALARLSDRDRTALIAYEIENKSTAEIAAAFGISEPAARQVVSRARARLRQVLSEWVIDETTGATALDMLSVTYRKAAEHSKKIGTAALSMVLLAGAFFGFWNNPSAPVFTATPKVSADPTPSAAPTQTPALAVGNSPEGSTATPVVSEVVTTAAYDADFATTITKQAVEVLATMGTAGWLGVDGSGMPVGFTVNNGAVLGEGLVTNNTLRFRADGAIVSGSDFITVKDSINVLLSQETTAFRGTLSYSASPMVRINGSWVELVLASNSVRVARQSDGNWVVTAYYIVDVVESSKSVKAFAPGMGLDATEIPGVVATRLLVTPNGQPVLAQAVQVLAPLAVPAS